MTSPYSTDKSTWAATTRRLVDAHPLKNELVKIIKKSWSDIFASSLGGYVIGKHLFPDPQVIGFFLHELIALNLAALYPGQYWKGCQATEKDVECSTPRFSFEIKTSSHKSAVFANRSYAQPVPNGKKSKDGYYLTVNFDKVEPGVTPQIRLIRFGFLEHSDWIAQAAATGQQAHLAAETYGLKFVTLLDNR